MGVVLDGAQAIGQDTKPATNGLVRGHMDSPPPADDFATIWAWMEELRRQREEAGKADTRPTQMLRPRRNIYLPDLGNWKGGTGSADPAR